MHCASMGTKNLGNTGVWTRNTQKTIIVVKITTYAHLCCKNHKVCTFVSVVGGLPFLRNLPKCNFCECRCLSNLGWSPNQGCMDFSFVNETCSKQGYRPCIVHGCWFWTIFQSPENAVTLIPRHFTIEWLWYWVTFWALHFLSLKTAQNSACYKFYILTMEV